MIFIFKFFFRLKAKNLKLEAINAFTLIELLIVISIMSILAAIMFGSQYAIREQIYLFQDQYKIFDMLNQAKSLTLGAFQRDSGMCGYGVSFNGDTGEVILYKDNKEEKPNPASGIAGTDCSNHPHEFNDRFDTVALDSSRRPIAFTLNKTEKFNFSGVKAAVFNMPSLNTFLTEGGSDVSDKIVVKLEAIKSGEKMDISINQFGQITTE